MKMLMFDYRDSEKDYFNNHDLTDFDIEFIKEPLNEQSELPETLLNEADIVSVFITSDVNENVIKRFKNLRIIATRSTGYDHIDLRYCIQNNIAVFNVGNYGERSVAQYTFMLMLALVRKLIPAYLSTQKGLVSHEYLEGRNIESLSLGILGCGAIGSSLAKIADFFGMKVYICSYDKNPSLTSFAEYVTKEQLLEHSDIISLHLPYKSESYHIINQEAFDIMKNGAYLINTARGELVDIIALYNSIISGKIAGAALDVIECEKLTICKTLSDAGMENSDCLTKAFVTQKLLGMENVIITPHIAYNTHESVEILLNTMFNSIRDYSKGLHTNQLR